MKTKITILTEFRKIPLYYSLKPFFDYKGKDYFFKFTKSIDYCINKDKNNYLIILRGIQNHPTKTVDETMTLLRQKYSRTIYFDDRASAAVENSHIIQYVDYYLKNNFIKINQSI